MKKGGDAMDSELPATSEILLPTDASKQILDTFLGQGWDTWGAGLGGSQASELMLQIFSAFNLVALAVISALCCATAFAEGASSAKTTSFGTLVLICAGIALLGIVAGIILRRR